MASSPLSHFGLAGVAAQPGFPLDALEERPELALCGEALEACGGPEGIAASLEASLGDPDAGDVGLVDLSTRLGLTAAEVAAVALAIAVDRELVVGRALAQLQAPVGGSRPTIGLLESALAFIAGPVPVIEQILTGRALETGLLTLTDSEAPIPERALRVPLHLMLALSGLPASRMGCELGGGDPELPLPRSLRAQASGQAQGLAQAPGRVLVLRSGSRLELRAVAGVIGEALGRVPLFLDGERLGSDVGGIVPWLVASDLLPVFERELSPAERWRVPRLPLWGGPVLVATGLEGGVEAEAGVPISWRIPVPLAAEREALWAQGLGFEEPARELAASHRHSAGRIADLSRLAHQRAEALGRKSPTAEDVVEVASASDVADLDGLAVPVAARVSDDGLVLADHVRRDLELLLSRCRDREALAEGLGIAVANRYRPGVSALLTGPSGTGKTLAAAWLATHLRLPLYRVDTASVVSKYIGETEKNLAQLLARAENAEVMLLFDEADSLFGKRTDVKQANDRFANAQTNYLLQRIESYDGIVVLTSNSRSRFDDAFTRRLDFIFELPPPAPEERRRLWLAHLGDAHGLSPREINRLAAGADVAGGHVRNAVLSAAVLARRAGEPIGWLHVLRGLELEYKKLGKQLPAELRGRT